MSNRRNRELEYQLLEKAAVSIPDVFYTASNEVGPPKENSFGHRYEGKSRDGYAVCSGCGCRENTDEAATICPECRVS